MYAESAKLYTKKEFKMIKGDLVIARKEWTETYDNLYNFSVLERFQGLDQRDRAYVFDGPGPCCWKHWSVR